MTEPPAVELQGTTPGGLPYPESTAPLNQGANDIKALALALDSRGAAVKTVRGRVVGAQFNGGRPPVVNIASAGLTTYLGGMAVAEWNVSGSSPNPMTCSIETSQTSATQVGVVGFVPAGPGVTGGWYTGTLTYDYLIWGT